MIVWRYYQIYLSQPDPTLADRLLLDVIEPLLHTHQASFERSFFLRYAEGGYHLRLRLLGDSERLDQQFYPALTEQLQRSSVTTTLRTATYEPEIEKYGGNTGLTLAEQHFDFSSQLVLRLLRIAQPPRPLWLGALMQTLIDCLSADEQAFWLRSYAEYWLNPTQTPNPELDALLERQFEQKRALLPRLTELAAQPICQDWGDHLRQQIAALAALEADQQLVAPLLLNYFAPLIGRLADYPRWQRCPLTYLVILPNYLHLLNNRAGISITQEAQLAYLLYRLRASPKQITAFPLLLEPQLLLPNRNG